MKTIFAALLFVLVTVGFSRAEARGLYLLEDATCLGVVSTEGESSVKVKEMKPEEAVGVCADIQDDVVGCQIEGVPKFVQEATPVNGVRHVWAVGANAYIMVRLGLKDFNYDLVLRKDQTTVHIHCVGKVTVIKQNKPDAI